jgi:hypothetical protein
LREPGIDAELETEGAPAKPGSISGIGSQSNDPSMGRLLCSAKVTAESICLLGCAKTQEVSCGYLWLNRETSWSGDSESKQEASSDIVLAGPGL